MTASTASFNFSKNCVILDLISARLLHSFRLIRIFAKHEISAGNLWFRSGGDDRKKQIKSRGI